MANKQENPDADCPSTTANIEQITANTHDTQRLLTILNPATAEQHQAVCEAQEVLAFWEKTELQAVRVAFEENDKRSIANGEDNRGGL